MSARRRRGGSESEQVPLIGSLTSEWNGPSQQIYDGPEHTDRQNRLALNKSTGE